MKFIPLFIGLSWLTAGAETVRNCSQIDVTHALTYNYDLLGRLDNAAITNINSSTWTGDYNYHKDGNLDNRTINSSPVENFAYTGDLLTDVDGAAVNWDNNGNMVAGLTSNIEWNWDKRLRHADVGADSIDCRYAPGGEMIYKRVYQDGTAVERKFIVDTVGRFPVILLEINSANIQIVKTYFSAQGQTLMQRDGSQAASSGRYFYLHDRLGSIRQLVNTSGQVVNCYVYDPYGNALDISGETQETVENRFRFAGYKWDPITGMYNCNARWYDPVLARFTGRDPVSGDFEEPFTLHAYLYCLNDPINGIDPTGEFTMAQVVGAIAIGFAIYSAADTAISVKGYIEDIIHGLNVRSALIGLGIEILCTAPMGKGAKMAWKAFDKARDVSKSAKALAKAGKVAKGLKRKFSNSFSKKISKQMKKRGWTTKQIDEAVSNGHGVPAINKANSNPATRYIHPKTGQSVVVDDVTGEVIHVGGPGFEYGLDSGDLVE